MISKSQISKAEIDQLIADEFGVNANYVGDLLQQFEQDPSSLDDDWQAYFGQLLGRNGHDHPGSSPTRTSTRESQQTSLVQTTPIAGQTTSTAAAQRTDSSQLERVALRGPALKIAENMQASLTVPTATSQRQIPIKLLEENRRLINQHLAARGRKISFTHLIVRAIVKAIDRFPNLNDTYEETNGTAYRVRHSGVNIGIAVDVTKKDGSRSLLVPNIKLANKLSFSELMNAYDDIVKRARDGKLQIEDFQGTTISLTNPGTIGTTASNPRLMNGQSIIVATGAMDYPPEYVAMSPEVTSRLGISKIMTLTSTYDHRIVQGAESGAFLALIDEMLRGKHQFYEQVFAELNILQRPYRWSVDRNPILEDRHRDETKKQASVLQLINSYRVRGHLLADLDPLGSKTRTYHPELDIETYGLTIWDLDREFICGGFGGKDVATLREIVEKLVKCYCGRSAIEYKHIESPEEKAWLAAIVEKELPTVPQEVKKQLLWKLISAEQFEKFLGTKYLGQKRFSIEGAETVVAMLDQLIESAADRGIDDITIGMAHRGRLNVLANVIGKFCERIFTIFEGSIHPSFPQDQHDVKYHQGATGERDTTGGSKIRVTVMPNPSHLEFIDPVVEGAVRAKQERLKQEDPSADIYKKLPVLAHGDAAFAGEGIVAETLNLSQLPGYSTGGTIHIIINNQLGFTTTPEEGRSSTYSTDVAKMVQAPIFHVNGDEPELVYQVLQTALDYRQKFHKDIVIDVIGFRRHGHNEGDEPTYTQPVMYKPIRLHPGIREIYSTRLIKEGILTNEELHSLIDERMRRYENAQLGAKETVARQGKDHILPDPLPEPDPELGLDTGVAQPILKEIGHAVNSVPRGFNLNPKIVGLLTRRAKMVEGEVAVDWGMAEALAFGSLLLEGTSVRLSGQDSVRGTFSQRHAGFYDSQTGDQWIPLSVLPEAKGTFCVYDSPLSEAGVLGFDYGYSVVWPESLVLWEAQFGDFVNAAQVIIDQFIAAGEEKWHQKCNLVMLLPHGYEGQGPEHSSGRVERFLQLCAGGNMFVVCATTASQYFHLLRRQIKKPINKPLIVMTPKSLLRMHEASSPISEFTTGEFRPVLPDTDITDNSRVKKALLCTGKVYYDLEIERRRIKDDTTAIIRVEQLYPFPKTLLAEQISLYNSNVEIRWVQEEPQNMGYWHYIEPRLRDLFKKEIKYIGRYPSSSTATGSHTIHHTEQKHLTEEAFK